MVFPPRPPVWKPLGDRLAAARAQRGWTQQDVAVRLNYALSRILYWEQGRHRPQRLPLRALATLLDVPYTELAALAGYPVDKDGGPSVGAT
jgi:transcriptional regulator with XRE-family HTH domain